MYSDMQEGFSSVNNRFDKVEARLESLETGQISLENRLERLEAGQISLENKLEDTRNTLFDGYIQKLRG